MMDIQLAKELDSPLQEELTRVVNRGIYSAIQYFSEYHEFINKAAIIKKVFLKEGAAHMALSTGEEIPLDQIISLNKVYSSRHGFDEFSCECD